MEEARAGLSNFRAKLLEKASKVTDRLPAQPLYRAALAMGLLVFLVLVVTASPVMIKGHATRVLIAESDLAEHAPLRVFVAHVPDLVSKSETAVLIAALCRFCSLQYL